jgi:hypothetical protein
MAGVLGYVASALAYTDPTSYEEAVNEALLEYGVDDIADVTGRENIRKLRAVARVMVWRQVVRDTTGDFDFSADGGRYSRSQINEQARESLKLAESEAMALGALAGYVVGIDAVSHIHDPYEYVEDDDRVIP